jgi:hypothetical protein
LQQARVICRKAEINDDQKIQLFYMDADNEKIVIFEDDDLEMAYALALSSDNKVKF